ncbi:GON-4-like protein [Etheostoma spectabile]|uniref:GON-4-like protein n=1 Tax=Etheostoma spectabile TaxID=54343 RepID=UPI0013AECB98|nr:GON-4-like protein [Etheostoma spectabile]
MGGSSDPTKLVSQFLLRKTLVQVRRRILQCCRPGVPDNIVKAFRYQRVLWPMRPVCRRVDPDQQRPPVEREEDAMPPWLLRSLPVIYSTIGDSSGPPSQAPPPRRSHMTYSFPPGTRYPPRLPKQLHFRRIGFLLLQKPRPPPPPALAVSMTTRERIRSHYQTLVGLRKKRRRVRDDVIGTEESDDVIRTEESDDVIRTEESDDVIRTEESDDVIRTEESDDVIRTEESDDVIRTEESDDVMRLVLSESSPSSAGSVAPDDSEEAESEKEQEVTADKEEEEEESVLRVQESSDYEEEAQDYLLRVCDAVQVSPGVSEELLQILDQVSLDQVSGSAAAERLYAALRRLLQPWPQLLRDFAAFLNRQQARRCGLLTEQQQFEHSRRFLRRLGRSLGGGSALYQQVVLALQRGSAPPPEELHQISSLLRRHSDLHKEFWEFIQQLHGGPSPSETNPPETDYESQNPPGGTSGQEVTARERKRRSQSGRSAPKTSR